jgi:flap endonuclease-1
MGIKNLNKFIQKTCNNSINKVTFWELKGKVIVVDASIYMYRFLAENSLIENMYQLVSSLLYYKIIPIFIFDGESPKEKYDVLKNRKIKKEEAKEKYNLIIKNLVLENSEVNEELKEELDNLQKQFIKLKKDDINNVKKLLELMGVNYFNADKEADELCAHLVIKQKAWACMSEDTDMFVYGCPRVLRYVSIMKCTTIMYDTKKILNTLNITLDEFKKICVVSGTDYNYNLCKYNTLDKTLKYFIKYKKSKSLLDFYDWLEKNTDYVKDKLTLFNSYLMFDTSNINLNKFEQKTKLKNKEELKVFLKSYGFLFIN